MQYISSLISGVAIFCVGTGFSFYHGINGLFHPGPLDDFMWAYIVLAGSLIFEGITLMLAINSIRTSAKETTMTFREYVISGQDPCVNVVLFEDTAAVAGAGVAAICIGIEIRKMAYILVFHVYQTSFTGLTAYLQSSIPDAVGSLLVGCMLAAVSSLIIHSSVPALVGRLVKNIFSRYIYVYWLLFRTFDIILLSRMFANSKFSLYTESIWKPNEVTQL